MIRLLRLFTLLLVVAASLASHAAVSGEPAARERLLLDFGWRFHLGNEWGIGQNLAKSGSGFGPASPAFSDAGWRRLDLPHDWAVELPFDAKGDVSHGCKALGEAYPQNSIGWYRRTFDLPASDSGRRIWLEFDGVFRDSTVFVNGWAVNRQESGYSSFRIDVTDVVECGGRNVVAVRVDATQTEGWFYEGAGIYRHVWLVKTGPLAIAPDGVFVYSTFPNHVPTGPATLHLETELTNAARVAADASVGWTVFAPDGTQVAAAQAGAQVAGAATVAAAQTVTIDAPVLWSPETPQLYRLVTTITSGGAAIDRVETEFGIRTVGFDAEKGFLLNGRPYVIKGTCNHQDHAGVGTAMPDRLQYFRISKLKEMGSNAYRSAHNLPTREVVEACDRLGMLVMDEQRLLGSDRTNLDLLARMIRRDRNHPSVVIWSIANEEFGTQDTPSGKRVAATMQDLIKRLDPTRPVTYNSTAGNDRAGINEVIEVRGWSYRIGVDRMDAYHAANPTQPNVGSEQGSTITTRGIYATDSALGYMSAYDDNQTDWSNTAKQWWSFFASRPWLSGGFAWTGFDYRGEPTPYAWPCINSHFGIFDTCGFPKDNFWNYQSWWSDRPVLHLMPHWNWAGREGQEIDVRALSNCDEVELVLNGASLGRQRKAPIDEAKWKVRYAPGTLSARGYRAGHLVAETKVETTGAPAAVVLTPDRAAIDANGEDVAIATVAIVDDQGRIVPIADDKVSFALTGPGRIIGVGNGDPTCHEPDVYVPTPRSHTRAIDGWRWQAIANPDASMVPEMAESFDDSRWTAIDVTAASGPLPPLGKGAFRAKFTLTAADLASPAVELWFGHLNGGGSVYLNGQRIGSTGDARAASTYDVKSRLRVGENSIGVVITNYGASGGVNDGVMLRLHDEPASVEWSRSAFNGLAQVIVKATRESGTLTLTARAGALRSATLAVIARPASHRAAVPEAATP